MSDIAPLEAEKLGLLLDFVQKMAEHERLDRRDWITDGIAAGAAVLAAAAAIAVGAMNLLAKADLIACRALPHALGPAIQIGVADSVRTLFLVRTLRLV
jgi:hypothetical protein